MFKKNRKLSLKLPRNQIKSSHAYNNQKRLTKMFLNNNSSNKNNKTNSVFSIKNPYK